MSSMSIQQSLYSGELASGPYWEGPSSNNWSCTIRPRFRLEMNERYSCSNPLYGEPFSRSLCIQRDLAQDGERPCEIISEMIYLDSIPENDFVKKHAKLWSTCRENPLLTAMCFERGKTTEVLFDHAPWLIDLQNNKGETPLHHACSKGESFDRCSPSIVKFLLKHGARSDIRDHKGRIPLDKASQNKERRDPLNDLATHRRNCQAVINMLLLDGRRYSGNIKRSFEHLLDHQ